MKIFRFYLRLVLHVFHEAIKPIDSPIGKQGSLAPTIAKGHVLEPILLKTAFLEEAHIRPLVAADICILMVCENNKVIFIVQWRCATRLSAQLTIPGARGSNRHGPLT